MTIMELAISWLAPPECIGCGVEGASFCQGCLLSEIIPFGERCYNCNEMSPGGQTCNSCRPSSPTHVWISTDYKGSPKNLVQLLKFRHQRASAKPIASVMADTLQTFCMADDISEYLLVPLPTATSRVRERSFDHTALLVGEIANSLGLKSSRALKRLGQSRQVGAKRVQRTKQADGLYYISKKSALKGRRILLVDDVVTTGASLRAATHALRKAGVRSVDALVFAKKL